MPDIVDPAVAAIAVALAGILLWLVTQFHLLRVAKAIRTDIDAKRTETMRFVDERLSKVEGLMGAQTALLTSQIPPSLQGDIAELRQEIDAFAAEMGKDVTYLKQTVGGFFAKGAEQERLMMEGAKIAGDELKALSQIHVDPRSEMEGQLVNWLKKPPPASIKKSPLLELAYMGAKKSMGDWILTGATGDVPRLSRASQSNMEF